MADWKCNDCFAKFGLRCNQFTVFCDRNLIEGQSIQPIALGQRDRRRAFTLQAATFPQVSSEGLKIAISKTN